MLIEVSSPKNTFFLLSVDNRFIGGVLINQPAEIVLNKLAFKAGEGKVLF